MRTIVFLFALILSSLFGSTKDTFELTKQRGGHYAFMVKMTNGVATPFMLESGTHVMLADSAFVFDNYEAVGLNFVACEQAQSMNLGGRVYRITHKAKGEFRISDDVVYRGEVFLLAGYESMVSVPIQNLWNGNSRIVKLNLAKKEISVVSQCGEFDKNWVSMPMNTNTYLNMPAVRTELRFEGADYDAVLEGNFNLDLGNASMLFLLEQSTAVKDFVKNTPNLTLQNGYDKGGKVVSRAFVPNRLGIGDIVFENPVVAITSVLPKFTTDGLLGLKFFSKVEAIFDFDRNLLHIRKQ